MSDLVRLTRDRGIATITLDHPAKRNALSAALMAQLAAHLRTASTDPAVRAVVLTHTGPTFCAGADLAEAAEGGMRRGSAALRDLIALIADTPVPVVAHLRGNARAGGIGLVAACDLAYAPADTTFAFSEARLGLAAAVISLSVLPRIDPRAADRYYLTGEPFTGAEAARIGLLTAAPDGGVEGVDTAVDQTLDHLRRCSRQGLTESKNLTAAPVREMIARRGADLVELSARLFDSAEAAEGMRAFAERRAPRWAAEAGVG